MKICLIALELLPVPPIKGGAVEKFVYQLGEHLSKEDGVEVHIISPCEYNENFEASNHKAKYHYIRIPKIVSNGKMAIAFRGIFYFLKANFLLRKLKPDIMHFNCYPAGMIIATLLISKKQKRVITFHNDDDVWDFLPKRIDRPFFGFGISQAHLVSTCSNDLKKFVIGRYEKFVKNKVSFIPNGVNTEQFKRTDVEVIKAKYSLTGKKVIIFAGRLVPHKGILVLLEAFKRMERGFENVALVVIGPKGDFWKNAGNNFVKEVDAIMASDKRIVYFEPIYDDNKLGEIYSMADVACIPSMFAEGFPLVSIEMQSCGVPVVGTDAGGLPETFVNQKTGKLISMNNPDAIVSALSELLTDDDRRAQMSRNAREHIERNFSWSIVSKIFLAEYGKILNDFSGFSDHNRPTYEQ